MIRTLRRNTELGLILLGAIITAGAYVLATLGRTASIPANIGPFLGVVFALLVVAHLATRRLAPTADGVLLPLAGLLNGIGYVFIARLNDKLAGLQATWTFIGIAAYIATLIVVRRIRDLERYRYTFMLIGIILLLLPLVPVIGYEINGARIWAHVGSISFQPGEPAKIVLAIFFASYLVEKREVLGLATWPRFAQVLPDPRHLGPVLLAWGASIVVMTTEKDLGSSLLFFALFILLLWVATARAAYLGVGVVLFAAGSTFAYEAFAHVHERVHVWINPWADASGSGFQVIQSWFAMAWGGVAGTGLGLGNPNRIPVVATDFIFAAIGEELGLLGTAAVIVAFLLLVGAGLRVAIRADGPFEKLLAAGLTILLGLQAFIIMAGVTRLLPLTGVTLPFVSYGGSSLVANYVLLALLVRISDDSGKRLGEVRVNTQLRKLGIGLLVCYVALFGMVNYVQVFRASALNDDPRNTRAIVRDFDRPRGQIIAADGTVLARTVPAAAGDQFEFQRQYPEGDLFGGVTGYFNINFGATGIEKTYNDQLSGQTTEQSLHSLSDLFVDREHTGDVTLTIRKDVQQVARDALGQQRGSVVALDPRTGDVLALWGFPSFDPNLLSDHDSANAQAVKDFLEAVPEAPLRNRTYQERFFPGSTFKVVTGSVGVQSGMVTVDSPVYPQLSSLDVPQTTRNLSNFGGETCGGTLFPILAVSCNTSFAQMGLDLGPDAMNLGAAAFGFNDTPPIDLPAAAPSTFPKQSKDNLPQLAQSSIGQNSVQATPLQMALVASAIANNGVMMAPHLMHDVRDDQGNVIDQYAPHAWKTPISPSAAVTMRQAMIGVVQNGTATRLQIPGVEVAGKTGTAQTNPTDPNSGVEAWIIAFAGPPGGQPTVAVTVLVEAQQGFSEATGGRVAAPIAQQVIQAVLASQA